MKQKIKAKNHQKQKQRRAAEGKARCKVDRITKNFMAQMQKRGIRLPMQAGEVHKESYSASANDILSVPECEGVGECCTNVIVNLDPADVWRIMHDAKVCQKYEIKTTMDLLSKGIIEYWVDPRVGVPRCKLNYIKKEAGLIECIFLQKEDGKASCLLGENKPTICAANPLGRVGVKDGKGRLAEWKYVFKNEPCKKCVNNEKECSMSVSDLLVSKKMEDRYKQTDLFYGLQGWIARDVKVDEMRKLATLVCFDWDRFFIEFCNHSIEELETARPESPEHVLAAARLIVDGIMKGQLNAGEADNSIQ